MALPNAGVLGASPTDGCLHICVLKRALPRGERVGPKQPADWLTALPQLPHCDSTGLQIP